MKSIIVAALLCILASSGASAQADPFSNQARYLHMGMKMIMAGSAERMPEERYDFRPTAEVRSYAEILGHIADVHYTNCSIVLGERNPAPRIDVSAMSKQEIVALLSAALTYCDRAYEGMTDAIGAEMVSFMGGPIAKLSLLGVTQLHGILHYGNLITYLRLNGLVPPTSDPGFLPSGQ